MIEVSEKTYKDILYNTSVMMWNEGFNLTFIKNRSIQCINFGGWLAFSSTRLEEYKKLLFLKNIKLYFCRAVGNYHHFVYYKTRKDLDNIIQVIELIKKKKLVYYVGENNFDEFRGFIIKQGNICKEDFFNFALKESYHKT